MYLKFLGQDKYRTEVLRTPYSRWWWDRRAVTLKRYIPGSNEAAAESMTLFPDQNNLKEAAKKAARGEYTRLQKEAAADEAQDQE